jgi:hypothetical protein
MTAADRARVEREAQGLPEQVEDERVLDQVVELLAEGGDHAAR